MKSDTPKNNITELNTTSSVISYISKIEWESADFYVKWASEHEELRESFLSFAKENKKYEKSIKRAYYNAVSDALETNFCFKGLRADVVLPSLKEEASSSEVLKASISMENSIQIFYKEAAEISRDLLADVPRAMQRMANSRNGRIEKLRSILEKE